MPRSPERSPPKSWRSSPLLASWRFSPSSSRTVASRRVWSVVILVWSVVILVAQVGDGLFAHHPAERVLELHRLDEEVVLRIEVGRRHRALEVEAQPLHHAVEARALREVHEEREIE